MQRQTGRDGSSSGHENALEGSVLVPDMVRALGLGTFGRTQRGQAAFDDGRESPTVLWPPLRLAWLRRERGSVGVVCPWFSRVVELDEGSAVRAIGLDVHRDFCEVAIAEAGNVRS